MTGSTAEPDAELMRESDQKPVKTGIPNRKKTAFATALSCKNLYFPAPTKPAESTACRFFTGDFVFKCRLSPDCDIDRARAELALTTKSSRSRTSIEMKRDDLPLVRSMESLARLSTIRTRLQARRRPAARLGVGPKRGSSPPPSTTPNPASRPSWRCRRRTSAA